MNGRIYMKLSTKGRYGLKAAIAIARLGETEAVPLSLVAENTGVSMSYLEQLIIKLKKAEIVTSTRGAQGGYTLARSADSISVGDILRALEGNLDPVECVSVPGESVCSASEVCVTKIVWQRISESINNAVDSIMLSELVKESKAIVNKQGEGYKEEINDCGC